MNVRVLLFAVAREIAGSAVVKLDTPQPATVAGGATEWVHPEEGRPPGAV